MPKSRFNAVREKARASRHNPLHTARRAGTGADGDQHEQEFTLRRKHGADTGSATTSSGTDVLPVLKSLPLDNSAAAEVPQSDVLWALTSLAGFLSSKAQRTELLHPKHDIVARILVHLHAERPIEVRDAASGCLRNLCIEAGGKARKMLETRECLSACLAEVRVAAEDLDLIERSDRDVASRASAATHAAAQAEALLNKPASEMNRKERRHAAKAEAAAAKRRQQHVPRQSVPAEVQDVQNNPPPSVAASPQQPQLSDEHLLACCSHLNNLAAVLWCLAEMSSTAMGLCERSAPLLCRVFARTTERAVESTRALRSSAAPPTTRDAQAENGTKMIDVGKRDRQQLDRTYIELGVTCLNALVTLSESNARVCAALIGIAPQELHSALKGKKKSLILDAEGAFDASTRATGKQSVQALQAAVAALHGEASISANGATFESGALKRQSTTLGLLALACLHNTQTALPSSLHGAVSLASKGEEPLTIAQFEMREGLQCLHKLTSDAQEASLGSVIEGLKGPASTVEHTSSAGDPPSTSKQRQAEDDINALNLGLEVLAELAGYREGWNALEKGSRGTGDELEVDDMSDEEMMDEGDDDNDDTIPGGGEDDEMASTGGDIIDREGSAVALGSGFEQRRIAAFFAPALFNNISRLAFYSGERIASSQEHADSADATGASALRGICIRSLSVLSNALLALASFARPPPSQPVASPAQEAQIAAFQAWLTSPTIAAELGQLWRSSFELASRVAALPNVAAGAASTSAIESRRIVESCLGVMWGTCRCFEGMPESSAAAAAAASTLVIDSAHFAGDDFCVAARQGGGVVESLVAAYRGSKKSAGEEEGSSTAAGAGAADTGIAVAGDPTTWASADGIRVHCLGVLSTLMRQAHVWPAHLGTITSLLCAAVDATPTSSTSTQQQSAATTTKLATLQLSDTTSIDGMIVAINGLIDTYADETRAWDTVYSQLKVHGKLKRASVDVRSAVRSGDGLRSEARQSAFLVAIHC